jgi:hypothetical protein
MGDKSVCFVCGQALDELLFWKDSSEQRYCCLHADPASSPFLSILGGARQVSHVDNDVLADLSSCKNEAEAARRKAGIFRDRLHGACADVPPAMSGNNGCLGIAVGDRTDVVFARGGESGSRIEHQLVGLTGMIKLTQKGRESGAAIWSVPKGALAFICRSFFFCLFLSFLQNEGKLVSVVATVGVSAGAPFLMTLEGEVSEVQLWCRTQESLDAWLVWIKRFHPSALQMRNPPLEVAPVATRLQKPLATKARPSSNVLFASTTAPPASSAAGKAGGTLNLRQRLQKVFLKFLFFFCSFFFQDKISAVNGWIERHNTGRVVSRLTGALFQNVRHT